MKTKILAPLIASVSIASAQTILIDFGDTIASTTTGLGNSWNSVIDSNPLSNMTDSNGGATTVDIFISGGGYGENGGAGGGGLASPSQALLGDFAVASATDDYFFTSGTQFLELTIGGLDNTEVYELNFFGTRDTAATRETIYSVTGGGSTVLQTSGTGAGSSGTGNDNTIASISGLSPNASDQIVFSFTTDNSTFGYLGAMSISVVPEPSAYGLIAGALALGWIMVRRRR